MHTWYLDVDTQLFITSPFVVYSIYRFKTKAIFAFVISVFECVFSMVAVHLHYELTTLRTNNKMDLAYFPTHIRFSAGYVFFKTRQIAVFEFLK